MSGVPSFCAAAAIALAAVWPLRRLALRVGLVDRPGPRKAHRRPTPYLGGCAVLAGASVIALGQPWEPAALVLLVAMAGLGLCDDARPAPVRTKLLVELALAIVAVDLGFSLQVTGLPAADGALTVLWLVGLTNSFNLLDNMDGLSSTVAASALVAMAVVAPGTAGVALPLAGAVAGFLVANLPPARLFLGDAGSLMIGFGVGLVGVRAAAGVGGTGGLVVLVAPVSVALFDTALVVVSRLRSGRPVQVGGTDHFSHRLLSLGWSPREVVGAALLATVAASGVAYLAGQHAAAAVWLALPLGVGGAAAWLRCARIDPYAASPVEVAARGEPAPRPPAMPARPVPAPTRQGRGT